jgi:hypothetical protein
MIVTTNLNPPIMTALPGVGLRDHSRRRRFLADAGCSAIGLRPRPGLPSTPGMATYPPDMVRHESIFRCDQAGTAARSRIEGGARRMRRTKGPNGYNDRQFSLVERTGSVSIVESGA